MKLERCINSGRIRSIRPVLEEWARVVAKYIKSCNNKDNPWWYNERASLSCLAAAAWRNGGIALEEYYTEKGKEFRSWNGRCDLYFSAGEESFGCEAKQAWCAIGKKARSGVDEAEKKLKDACKEARQLSKDEGRRLGLCFAVPYLPIKDKMHLDTLLNKWIEELKSLEYSSIAWIFPGKSRYHTHEGELYPGVVLLIREVFR